MAEYLIQDTTLIGIADAIRSKKGSSAPVPVASMKDEILALSGDTASTLPPPISGLNATGGNQTATISFESVASEYERYLGDPAYIVVLKMGSIPESPTDGVVVKLDKNGAVIV